MEIIIGLVAGAVLGAIVVWLVSRSKTAMLVEQEKTSHLQRYNALENDFIEYKAIATTRMETGQKILDQKGEEMEAVKKDMQAAQEEVLQAREKLSAAAADLGALRELHSERKHELEASRAELENEKKKLTETNQQLARAIAEKEALTEKLQVQKEEIEAIGKKLNTEFENIANKILDIKTEKFTQLNHTNLKTLLEPLGQNITEFKTKVEEVYDKESKERFSLGERVKELAALNKVISEEAQNLTRALKSESKTQGGWGEMILESILEKSGLVKNREYFLEHQLVDSQGNPLRSDSDRKLRPDAVIKYPDNRHVIIDSKVSLNAFVRCIEAIHEEDRQTELKEHVNCLRKHILGLHERGYDDYDKSLDFVMMFVPSEPAYIAAMQADPDLWNFAYDRRILLLSPTNLITSLKLIADLWKREYQNKNALDIAERGAKLYDKFVGFVSNLQSIGDHLDKARSRYDSAYKQLTTGNDNLVSQATKLKDLGLKTKKNLPDEIVDMAVSTDIDSEKISGQLDAS